MVECDVHKNDLAGSFWREGIKC